MTNNKVEIKKREKIEWLERGQKGIEQENLFFKKRKIESNLMYQELSEKEISGLESKIQYLSQTTISTKDVEDKIISTIKDIIKENKKFEKGFEKLPIRVNMRHIVPGSKCLDNYITKYNKKVESYIDELNNRQNEEDKKCDDLFNFIYVVQRNDGMVTVVGKTSFTRKKITGGDLYKRLDTNGLVGTENVILRTLFGNQLAEKLDELLINYFKCAWIIPINVPADIVMKTDIDTYVMGFEKELGEGLIKNCIPILNYYSHTNGYKEVD